MKYKRFGNKVIFRIDSGEEIIKSLKKICKNLNIKLGTIGGIGATDKVTIGLYDVKAKQYHLKEFIDDYEIASLYGNITMMGDKIYLHLHANVCNQQCKSFGGHLDSAIVSATFEGIIDIIDAEIKRVFEKKIGLNLMDI